MVWACQHAPDDTATGVESVKIKPLKKRCTARAGLSRFYSSKSQSFSSIDLVHCTPFGNSALALAKRPSSFDLRRGSPRCSGLGSSHPVRIRKGSDSSYLSAATEDDEGATERCPCNDTIFTDPSDAVFSPESSPRASPTHNMYDSLSLTCATLPYVPSYQQQFQEPQQQHQHQLSNDYLSQLSVLLPMQYGYLSNPSAGGLSETSLSSCCSSGSACNSSCRTGSCSFFSGLSGESASPSSRFNCSSNLCRNSCPASWLRPTQSSEQSALSCTTVRLSSDTSSTPSTCQHINSRAASSCGDADGSGIVTAARLHSMPSAAFFHADAVRFSSNYTVAGSSSNGVVSAVQAAPGTRISSYRSRAWTLPSAGADGNGGISGQCPQGAAPPAVLSGNLSERAAVMVAAAPCRDTTFSVMTGQGGHICNLDRGVVVSSAVGLCCRPQKLSRHTALGRHDSGLTSGAGAAPSVWESAEELIAAISLRDNDQRFNQQYACMG